MELVNFYFLFKDCDISGLCSCTLNSHFHFYIILMVDLTFISCSYVLLHIYIIQIITFMFLAALCLTIKLHNLWWLRMFFFYLRVYKLVSNIYFSTLLGYRIISVSYWCLQSPSLFITFGRNFNGSWEGILIEIFFFIHENDQSIFLMHFSKY